MTIDFTCPICGLTFTVDYETGEAIEFHQHAMEKHPGTPMAERAEYNERMRTNPYRGPKLKYLRTWSPGDDDPKWDENDPTR